MLFRRDDKERIRQGRLRSTFRKWKSPRAKPGGRYNLHPEGAIEVDRVEVCTAKTARKKDLKAAGFQSQEELATALGCGLTDDIYHVAFHYLGPALVNQPSRGQVDDSELDALIGQLCKMDDRATRGPWTTVLLRLIESQPATRAADLAATIGWETPKFKAYVRRLKKLGLTNSLEVGYKLSSRGKQVVSRLSDR